MEKMVDMGFNGLMMVPPSETAALYGGSVKQERSHNGNGEDDEWRSLKMAKHDDLSTSKAMLLQQRSHQQQQHTSLLLRSAAVNNNNNHNSSSLFPDGQMLSFSSSSSSSKSEAALPYFQSASASSYNRSYAGYGSGSLNGASMHGVLTGLRGHFTQSQWMELERQALIYKYIDANVPIPASLLITMRRAPETGGFPNFSTRADAFGWGAFHLGFANNTDPEPGRCRRTDGKKWRCSRDAVADQKYCERHMNRGRHRSRKPVEGQSGHSAATSVSNNITTTTAQNTPVVVMQSGSGTSNGLAGGQQHQVKNLLPGVSTKAPTGTIFNRALNGGGMQDTRSMSMLSSSVNQNPKESMISTKQQLPFGQSPQTQFGLVFTDSLLNPSHGGAPFSNCKNYSSPEDLSEHQQESQHPSLLRHFMDDWPKMQQDQTQLSISIPMTSSEYNLSSTSSPPNDKNEFSVENPLQMGLGLGSSDLILNDQNLRQPNSLPITWETSVGGPLGEALHISHNNNAAECKNASALNLMTEGWDGSPRIGSSPTGVLQKATFCSLSNSSTGSSPRAEASKAHERSALCNDLLGSALARSSAFPYL